MSSLRTDQPSYPNRIYPEPFSPQIDHFNRIPDSLLLLVFNKIGDVKALGRCCVVSRRFHSLVPQVENVLVRVDCVISGDNSNSSAASSDKSRGPFWNLIRLVFGETAKPIQTIGQFLGPKRGSGSNSENSSSSPLAVGSEDDGDGGVTHHSPTQAALVKDPSVSVNRVIWSPDGALFGVAYSRHIVQIYSYHSGDEVRQHNVISLSVCNKFEIFP